MFGITSSIFKTQVRKSPDISQADGIADHREHEVQLAAPLFPFGLIVASLEGRSITLRILKYMFEL